jgi:hypothetical protein
MPRLEPVMSATLPSRRVVGGGGRADISVSRDVVLVEVRIEILKLDFWEFEFVEVEDTSAKGED